MPVRRVALLTAGGLAPCLSSAVGGLIERYTEVDPSIEIVGYLDGSITTPRERFVAHCVRLVARSARRAMIE